MATVSCFFRGHHLVPSVQGYECMKCAKTRSEIRGEK
jgi:hypothetical protein